MNDYQKFILEKLGNIDCIGYLHSVFVIGVIESMAFRVVGKRGTDTGQRCGFTCRL